MTDLDRLIDLHGPALICDALRPLMTEQRLARIEQVLDARLTSLVTIVEDLYDPHNGAAAIRSTEALGLQDFHACEGVHRFAVNDGVTKGCHRWLDLHRWPALPPCADALRARGFKVYATAPDAPVDLDHIDVSAPIAVVFGNEHAGVSDAGFAACDGTVSIPMFGFTESFNLSVSVALVMSRLAARRREVLGRRGDLPDERRDRLRARWYGLGIRGAVGVIERHVSAGTRPVVAP
ncbi:MAG: RNA methyltransferase [Kofleriaceae bacterium]|nr:RNA methyltransferase [Myxococcales bacterium]MCB9562098.1 RNA methyltransferase [Kofleriaceae bacterium]